MRVLFLHQNFPGQFRHLVRALCDDPAHEVWGLGEAAAIQRNARLHPRLRLVSYQLGERPPSTAHPYLVDAEGQVRRGQVVARALLKLQAQGVVPDVVVAHPGWGEALFVKDVFPHVPLLSYVEFFFSAEGADVGFDPEFPSSLDARLRLRLRNALGLSGLHACDAALTPTRWQRSRVPAEYQARVALLHEGVDTDLLRPDPAAEVEFDGERYAAGEPVVTYVARNLEPYRGIHVFLRALPELLARAPHARVLVVGGDDVSYGRRPEGGGSWRAALLAELGDRLDPARVRFTGKLPHETYRRVLQVSAAHVYLTYPFVLSWSMLEAMACGALVVGSRTAPVAEVIEDGVNGRLVGFFDRTTLVDAVATALADPAAQAPLRAAARATVVERFDLKRVCLPAGLALIADVAAGRPVAA